jgi:hypothetical protein
MTFRGLSGSGHRVQVYTTVDPHLWRYIAQWTHPADCPVELCSSPTSTSVTSTAPSPIRTGRSTSESAAQ